MREIERGSMGHHSHSPLPVHFLSFEARVLNCLIFFSWFTVIVLGAFIFCYLPAFIVAILTANLGPLGTPIPLAQILVLSIAINSALNPIVYTYRSNEFKRAFRNIFRGDSIEPQINVRTIGLPRVQQLENSSLDNGRPSFLALPNENAASPDLTSEAPVTAKANTTSSTQAGQ